MKTEPKHTPLSWMVEFNQSMPNQFIINSGKDGPRVCYIAPQPTDSLQPLEQRAEFILANFIVTACNNYERVLAERDELADVLTLALPYVETAMEDQGYKAGAVKKMSDKIRAALAKIGGNK